MFKLFKRKMLFILAIMLSLFVISGCESQKPNVSEMSSQSGDASGKLAVHFIDVGQGDSSLIVFPNGETALIDGGGRDASSKVVSYLKGQGVEKIDYMVATHPHEDHIGGLPEVVRNFEIGKVYMPKRTANTKIFEELLSEIKDKGLKINVASEEQTISDKDGALFSILGPLSDSYEDTNDHSVVNKLLYGKVSILFTGDIESLAEGDLVKQGYDLKADVLKVPHHGSSSSSSDVFLDAVSPSYGVIQLGADNSYGHPHRETIQKYSSRNIEVLRNDVLGDIKLESDGEAIRFYSSGGGDLVSSQEPGQGVSQDKASIIGNKNSKVYHLESCSGLPNEENRVYFDSIEEAEQSGFRPDSRCVK